MTDDDRPTTRMSRGSAKARPDGGRGRRSYRQGARADQQALTRQRIARAAVELHGTIGPARTTISAVAERAGVERLTVYRHYPDDAALFAACSAHFLTEHPPPDLERPMSIAVPDLRLEAVLLALYRYYRETAPTTASLLRDAETVPLVEQYLHPYRAMLVQVRDALTAGFGSAPGSGSPVRVLAATIGHALAFTTWRSLALEQGLADRQAAALMTELARTAATDPPMSAGRTGV